MRFCSSLMPGTVVDPFHHVLELAAHSAGLAVAKESRDAVGGQQIKTQFAGALKDGTDGPGAFEDEVAAVFDLLHDVEPVQAAAGGALLGRKLRSQDESPIVNALLKGFGIQLIGCGLEFGRVGHRDEPIVVLDEFDPLATEFSLDEIVPVEIGGDRERQKGADPQDHGPGHRVDDVKVIVGVEAAMCALGWAAQG
jgi:hypothetical protein